jgi:autotransporter-associated beta strand protein
LKTSRRKILRGKLATPVAITIVTFIASGAVATGLLTLAPRATLNSVSLIARTLNPDSTGTQETSDPSTIGPTASQHRGTLSSALTDAGRRIFNQATGTNKGSPASTGNKSGAHSGVITNRSSGAGKSLSIRTGTGMDAPGRANSHSGGAPVGGGTLVLSADRTVSNGALAIAIGSGTGGGGARPNHIERQQQLAPLANISWTGLTTTSWNLATNWSSLTVPGASDNAVFNGTFILGNQPQVTASATVGGLWMTTGVGQNVTLSSSIANILTLNGNTINGIPNLGILVDNSSAFTLTISSRLTLGNSQTWINNSANLLSIIPGGATLVTNGHALTIDGSGNTSISKVISGAGSLTKNGGGILTLSGGNTYTGGVTINAGTLTAGSTTALGPAANATLTFGPGSTGKFQLNGNNTTVIGLNTNATVGTAIVENGAAGAATLTVNTATSNTYAGVLQNGGAGTLSLVKSGTGSLTLSGANTYGGTTTVSGGTLLVNNTTGSGTGTGAVTVSNSGTTLGGTGTINGTVTINSGAMILGGTGAAASGALTLANNLTLNSGSIIELALGAAGAHSTLARTGGTWSFQPNQAFTFIDLGATIGTYNNIITGLASDPGTGSWTITNSGFAGTFTFDGANIDLTLGAVPEPSTWIGGALALAALGYTQRRRFVRLRKQF